jgi:hypothetical protein
MQSNALSTLRTCGTKPAFNSFYFHAPRKICTSANRCTKIPLLCPSLCILASNPAGAGVPTAGASGSWRHRQQAGHKGCTKKEGALHAHEFMTPAQIRPLAFKMQMRMICIKISLCIFLMGLSI